MHLCRLVMTAWLALSFAYAPTALADSCSMVEEAQPPFYVVNSKGPLNRTANGNQIKGVYFPKGTIVKLDPADLIHIPLISKSVPFSFMPRVKVLSVPDDTTSLNLSGDKQHATITHDGVGAGQRVTVGMEANISGADLSPSIVTLASAADVARRRALNP